MECCADGPTALSIYVPAAAVLLAASLAGWLAYKAKIAEFRQRWINDLREDIADLLGLARRYHRTRDLIFGPAGETSEAASTPLSQRAQDERPDEQLLRDLEHRMDPTYNRIELRINPRDNPNRNEDQAFLDSLKALLTDLPASESDAEWPAKLETAMAEARELLKREWEVTKSPLPREIATRFSEIQRRPRI